MLAYKLTGRSKPHLHIQTRSTEDKACPTSVDFTCSANPRRLPLPNLRIQGRWLPSVHERPSPWRPPSSTLLLASSRHCETTISPSCFSRSFLFDNGPHTARILVNYKNSLRREKPLSTATLPFTFFFAPFRCLGNNGVASEDTHRCPYLGHPITRASLASVVTVPVRDAENLARRVCPSNLTTPPSNPGLS